MCGCGGSEAVNRPESADLVAIIHPAPAAKSIAEAPTSISRRDSASSTRSFSSVLSATSSAISTTDTTSDSCFKGSRLRFSNDASATGMSMTTVTDFSQHDDSDTQIESRSASTRTALENFHVRIHRFGFPSDVESMPNPVVHSFSLAFNNQQSKSCGIRFDLGLGGEGILGRTVSLCDDTGNLVGEGVLGRI